MKRKKLSRKQLRAMFAKMNKGQHQTEIRKDEYLDSRGEALQKINERKLNEAQFWHSLSRYERAEIISKIYDKLPKKDKEYGDKQLICSRLAYYDLGNQRPRTRSLIKKYIQKNTDLSY